MDRIWLGAIVAFIVGWLMLPLGAEQAGGLIVYCSSAVLLGLAVVALGRAALRAVRP